MTPPSAIASRTRQAKAGPDPERAVQASKCFSSKNLHLPIGLNMDVKILRSRLAMLDPVAGGVHTVMPSRICGRYSVNSSRFRGKSESVTHLARRIWHCSDNSGALWYPSLKLRYPCSGQYRNQEFAFQRGRHSLFCQDALSHLRFTTRRTLLLGGF